MKQDSQIDAGSAEMRLNVKSASWPLPYVAVFLVLFGISSLMLNPMEWIFTSVVAVLGIREVLKVNIIPIQLAFFFPFLEISTSLLDAELNGSDINEYFYGHGQEIYWLSLIALVGVFVAWKRASRGANLISIHHLHSSLAQYDLRKLMLLYFAFQVFTVGLNFAIPRGTSIFQLVTHSGILKGTVFALIIWSFKASPRQKSVFWPFIIYAVVSSFFSFFSAWKSIFIISGFVLIIQDSRPSTKTIRNMAVVLGIGFAFVMTWQGVKVEYRNFLNGGTGAQRIVVSQQESLIKLSELTGKYWTRFTVRDDDKGDEQPITTEKSIGQRTLERVGYLDLFCRMRQYVPDDIPHEQGDLLKDNLTFALIPRFLNPNKGVKDDQWKVEKYARRIISDNSSFSLGHYAEHFIDFGARGMMLSLLIFGFFGGLLTRLTMSGSGGEAIDGVFCFYWMQYFLSYQFDAIKIYGGVFWAIITYLLFWRPILIRSLGWVRS